MSSVKVTGSVVGRSSYNQSVVPFQTISISTTKTTDQPVRLRPIKTMKHKQEMKRSQPLPFAKWYIMYIMTETMHPVVSIGGPARYDWDAREGSIRQYFMWEVTVTEKAMKWRLCECKQNGGRVMYERGIFIRWITHDHFGFYVCPCSFWSSAGMLCSDAAQ